MSTNFTINVYLYLIIHSRLARHDTYVLLGEQENDFIPKVCAYFDLREYHVEGMVGLYNKVIPYP